MNVSTVKSSTLIWRGRKKNVLNHFFQQVVPIFGIRDYQDEKYQIKSIFLLDDSLVQGSAPSIQVQLHIQRDCAALPWSVKILSSRSHTQSYEKLWFCSWKTDCIAKHIHFEESKKAKMLLQGCQRSPDASAWKDCLGFEEKTLGTVMLKLSCPSGTMHRKQQCKWPIKILQRQVKTP